eukprot:CAMPEP_0206577418 /NCGR_PEP_ID=MMETSP0325_2-20121206/31347_1 /ASSEMBLY_ACC=CAM_ASM_000347 /TAXON_ID=2866 /ORGANISM="Crypthecodinium cohnii, Strain Seligo" /LENGTH=101 /DNA_ID=CAMNT_0054082845 /DNA_START=586 /DNA_END=888 /DNA_ORIENTATION=-
MTLAVAVTAAIIMARGALSEDDEEEPGLAVADDAAVTVVAGCFWTMVCLSGGGVGCQLAAFCKLGAEFTFCKDDNDDAAPTPVIEAPLLPAAAIDGGGSGG